MFIHYLFFREFDINSNSNRFNMSLTTAKRDLQYMVDEKVIKKYTEGNIKIFSANGL